MILPPSGLAAIKRSDFPRQPQNHREKISIYEKLSQIRRVCVPLLFN
jgi:hypothetical protein